MATKKPPLPKPLSFELDIRDLQRGLQAVKVCLSEDETRARLTYVQMQRHKDSPTVELNATDTHRLGHYKLEAKSPPFSILLGSACRDALLKLDPRKGNVSVTVKPLDEWCASATFDQPGSGVTIEQPVPVDSKGNHIGEFPNVRKILRSVDDPDLARTTVDLDFRAAVQRCATVARDDNRKIVVAATPAAIEVTAHSAKLGRARDLCRVEVRNLGDHDLIGLNGDYFAEGLGAALKLGPTEFCFGRTTHGKKHPIELRAERFTYCLMPMQIV